MRSQVEDLKFSHSQAVERVRELQRFSVQLCEQAGVEPAQVSGGGCVMSVSVSVCGL